MSALYFVELTFRDLAGEPLVAGQRLPSAGVDSRKLGSLSRAESPPARWRLEHTECRDAIGEVIAMADTAAAASSGAVHRLCAA